MTVAMAAGQEAQRGTVSQATRRTILLLSCGSFSSVVSQRICDAMLPELSSVFAVSLAQAAQVISAFAITYGIAQLFYGPLGDRLGKFKVITYCTLGCCLGSVLAVFATSLPMLLFARLLTALGAAALIPLAMAWVGDSVPTDRLQEMLTRTGLGSTVGIVTGQVAGGLLTEALGWRWALAFPALLFATVGSLLYRNLRRQQAAAALLPKAPPKPQPAGVQPKFFMQALNIVKAPWSRLILLVTVVEGSFGFGVLAMWASHLHGSLKLSLTFSGAIASLFGLGGVAYMLLGKHMIRRFDQAAMCSIGGVIVAICAVVVAYTPYWLLAVPASLICGFGFFMFHNVMQAHATQMAPHARGTAVSLFISVMFFGQSIGVVLAAALGEGIGSSAVVAIGGCAMALNGAFLAWNLRRREAARRVA